MKSNRPAPQLWTCPSCSASQELLFNIVRRRRHAHDLIRYRCTTCLSRHDVEATHDALLAVLPKQASKPTAFRRRMQQRSARAALRRLFQRELNQFDDLAEIARKEGGWRSG